MKALRGLFNAQIFCKSVRTGSDRNVSGVHTKITPMVFSPVHVQRRAHTCTAVPPSAEFHLKGEDFCVSSDVQAAFNRHGFIVVRNLLDHEEICTLKTVLEDDDTVKKYSFLRDDGAGKQTKYLAWNQPGDDITGMIARSEKVAGTFEKLLGDEVYHYHAKLIQKDANTGGAFQWHQDYGYWYDNGLLYPNMGTVFIALDEATKLNGCLQVLDGSHSVGRINHIRIGQETGADPERLEHLKAVLPLVHVELGSGDSLFFHCNLLHSSAQNNSSNRRWAYLIAYNCASNNPVIEHYHPSYTPLNKIKNSDIKSCHAKPQHEGKDFFNGQYQFS